MEIKKQEEGRVITWKIVIGIIIAVSLMVAGLLGEGWFIIFATPERFDPQAGWLCIGIMILGGSLVMMLPWYMNRPRRQKDKKEVK